MVPLVSLQLRIEAENWQEKWVVNAGWQPETGRKKKESLFPPSFPFPFTVYLFFLSFWSAVITHYGKLKCVLRNRTIVTEDSRWGVCANTESESGLGHGLIHMQHRFSGPITSEFRCNPSLDSSLFSASQEWTVASFTCSSRQTNSQKKHNTLNVTDKKQVGRRWIWTALT